jgi:hypothetical protein
MRIVRALVAVLIAALACGMAGGCTGTSRSSSNAPGVPLPTPAATSPAPQDRMSIATASAKDIAATLRANGVDDPEHWAKVVTDHRPYPPEDPSLGKLREILNHEHAAPDTTQRIVGVLAP